MSGLDNMVKLQIYIQAVRPKTAKVPYRHLHLWIEFMSFSMTAKNQNPSTDENPDMQLKPPENVRKWTLSKTFRGGEIVFSKVKNECLHFKIVFTSFKIVVIEGLFCI